MQLKRKQTSVADSLTASNMFCQYDRESGQQEARTKPIHKIAAGIIPESLKSDMN